MIDPPSRRWMAEHNCFRHPIVDPAETAAFLDALVVQIMAEQVAAARAAIQALTPADRAALIVEFSAATSAKNN